MSLVYPRRAGPKCGQGALRARGIVEGDLDQLRVLGENLLQITGFVLLALSCAEGGFVVFIRGYPLQFSRSGAPGKSALGLHTLAPGGEVTLEIGDKVSGRVKF